VRRILVAVLLFGDRDHHHPYRHHPTGGCLQVPLVSSVSMKEFPEAIDVVGLNFLGAWCLGSGLGFA